MIAVILVSGTSAEIELIDFLGNYYLLILLKFIVMIVLLFRYLTLTVKNAQGVTTKLYSETYNMLNWRHRETLLKTRASYELMHKLLEEENFQDVLEHIRHLINTENDNDEDELFEINNPAIAQVLRTKKLEARKSGIDLAIELNSTNQFNYINVKDIIVVLGNLLDNAIRGSIESGGNLIRLSWKQDPVSNTETLTIENKSKKNIEVELPKFFDVGYTTKKEGSGGSGLPMVKRTVVRNRGKISVNANNGSITFSLTFKPPAS